MPGESSDNPAYMQPQSRLFSLSNCLKPTYFSIRDMQTELYKMQMALYRVLHGRYGIAGFFLMPENATVHTPDSGIPGVLFIHRFGICRLHSLQVPVADLLEPHLVVSRWLSETRTTSHLLLLSDVIKTPSSLVAQ